MNINKAKKTQLNLFAFWPAFIILASFILTGAFFTKPLGAFLDNVLYYFADHLGWYFSLIALACPILAIAFVIGKYGDIRIGGDKAKPKFNMFSWCAITICGGIGTGLLFWAMGEPIYHFATPPVAAGVEPFTREAAIFAVSQAMWNWTFIQYSMYTLCAVGFALVTFNRKKSLSFGSLIEVVFGKRIPWLETLVHVLVIFCLCAAVANSMGVGLLQIGAGLEAAFGIEQSPFIWLVTAILIGVFFIISCVSGLSNGLKRVASVTIYIFLALLAYVLVFGDTMFIGKISAEAIGSLMDTWAQKTVTQNTMAPEDSWYANWIFQFWAQFLVYAPVIGMFLSRMAYGRTVRQFVLVNVLVPSLFCILWIGVFGGMTVSLQINEVIDVWGTVNESGMQSTVFQILGSLPMGSIVTLVFLITICFSFCTLADPMASVLATLSVKNLNFDEEPPRNIKIIMGVIITVAAYILVASGGMSSIKGVYAIIGLILSVVVFMCFLVAFRLSKECITEENHGVIAEGEANQENKTIESSKLDELCLENS
ncbi:BCCT family transporter [Vibrio sp. 10N.286.48.C11]|jgi:choline-glycine betaine transporter|uniref:BCCT family transporter n=1 Tax=Vibrio TaxID=662 RepID=UPI003553A047